MHHTCHKCISHCNDVMHFNIWKNISPPALWTAKLYFFMNCKNSCSARNATCQRIVQTSLHYASNIHSKTYVHTHGQLFNNACRRLLKNSPSQTTLLLAISPRPRVLCYVQNNGVWMLTAGVPVTRWGFSSVSSRAKKWVSSHLQT